MIPTQFKTMNLEIKLPNEDELHYLQIHSTSTVCTLKSKIFRKATALADENAENYVIVLRQHSKTQILAEDKVIGNYPSLQQEHSKNKVITLYVLPKNEKCHINVRQKEGNHRANTYEENRKTHFYGRNHSTKQLVAKDKHEEHEDSIDKPSLVRSKSEPILHTTRSLSSFSDLISEQSVDVLSSDVDSWSEEELEEVPLSPASQQREGTPAKDKHKTKDGTSQDSSDKAGTPKENRSRRWALWQKEKEVKHKKHASMIVAKSDVAASISPFTSNPDILRSPPTTSTNNDGADTSIRPKSAPPPVDYSLKKNNNNLVVEEDGGKLVVTGGTVEHLVYSLADRDIPDPSYLDDFLYSMSYFTNGTEVMKHLRNRYQYPAPELAAPEVIADYDKWRLIIQQRVLNVMRYIIDNHWYHFERDSDFFPLMRDFADEPFVRANPRAKGLRDAVSFRSETYRDANRRTTRGFSSPPVPDTATITSAIAASPAAPSPPGHHQHSTSAPGAAATTMTTSGSVDLATHGRSSSSPIIVWRSRRDTEANINTNNNNSSSYNPHSSTTSHYLSSNSSSNIHNNNTSSNLNSSNNTTGVGFEELQQSTPTSLTTVASSTIIAPPKTLGKRFKDYRKVSFARVPPLEMARQLTLIEKELFRVIKPPEVAGSAFKKKNKAEIAPNVVQMIDWFNHITTWVQREVVMTPNLKERTTVLAQFIQVAAFLRELGNFSGAMQVVCALDTVSVKRLHKTWKGLTRKESATFTSLQETFGSETNYANYRRLIHEPTNNGLIPYIGLVLQDLLMIEEIPTYLNSGMVNFRKMRRFASVLRSEILERQATLSRFNFEPIPPIQEYLARHTPLSDQELYKCSRLNEPSKMV